MKIIIEGSTYTVIDAIESLKLADSFVLSTNKTGTAHGEGKLYIGQDNSRTTEFFGARGFSAECFLLRKDLISYLESVEREYKKPSRSYRRASDFPALWISRMKKVKDLDEVASFKIDDQKQLTGPRVYVNSSDNAYRLIREIAIPELSYISVLKLETDKNDILYYFKPFVDPFDYEANDVKTEEEIEKIQAYSSISDTEKKAIIKARKGQGKFRAALLNECFLCPITLVSDERFLIASHIKPWVLSDNSERLDPKNGFMFTPTFDHLFDRGYITFTDNKEINISPWLPNSTRSKLDLVEGQEYPKLQIEGRKNYLKYHRNEIFKK